MTDPETAPIEMTRHLARKLIGEITRRGIEPADATVALAYALHDAASELTGNHVAGLEWIRTACDVMERQLMENSDGKPTAH